LRLSSAWGGVGQGREAAKRTLDESRRGRVGCLGFRACLGLAVLRRRRESSPGFQPVHMKSASPTRDGSDRAVGPCPWQSKLECLGTVSTMKTVLRRLILAYSVRNRQRKASMIGSFMMANGLRSVIFVGVAGEGANLNEDVLERAVEQSGQVVAAFNVYPTKTAWPFLVADGCAMPFKDKAADLVLSSAIIEHVGGEAQQRQFVYEHGRVGTAWVITTPNKWFPVESHTTTMFRHWSPKWRSQRDEFTRLLSRREFKSLLPGGTDIKGRPWSPTFMAFFAPLD
jgi:hypothetical protein